MNDHRIYFMDTRADSPFFGERVEYMRNINFTDATIILTLNSRPNSNLLYWSERHQVSKQNYETQRYDEGTTNRPLPGHHQGRGRSAHVPRDRTEQAQPKASCEIHVRTAGPRPAPRQTKDRSGRPTKTYLRGDRYAGQLDFFFQLNLNAA